MSKIINFFKTNYFIKGFIIFLIGYLLAYVRGYFVIQSGIETKYIWLKFIFMLLFVSSAVFFIISLIKERIIFKIFSACCMLFVVLFLAGAIAVEIKYYLNYQLKSQSQNIVEVTENYNECVREASKKFLELQERSLNLTSKPEDYEKWIDLQKEYLRVDIEYKNCLEKLFTGKRIFVK